MHNSDYYREQAAEYRKLAEAAENPAAKKEFLELAEACEEVGEGTGGRKSLAATG